MPSESEIKPPQGIKGKVRASAHFVILRSRRRRKTDERSESRAELVGAMPSKEEEDKRSAVNLYNGFGNAGRSQRRGSNRVASLRSRGLRLAQSDD